jgi:hypothetical protein
VMGHIYTNTRSQVEYSLHTSHVINICSHNYSTIYTKWLRFMTLITHTKRVLVFTMWAMDKAEHAWYF